MRKHHPFSGDTISLPEFAAWCHAVVEAPSRSQEIFERFLRQHKVVRPIALRCPHFLSLPLVIARTDLIATVPDSLANRLIDFGLVRKITPSFAVPSSQSKLLWHRNVHGAPRHRWMRELLIGALRPLARRDAARRTAPPAVLASATGSSQARPVHVRVSGPGWRAGRRGPRRE